MSRCESQLRNILILLSFDHTVRRRVKETEHIPDQPGNVGGPHLLPLECQGLIFSVNQYTEVNLVLYPHSLRN